MTGEIVINDRTPEAVRDIVGLSRKEVRALCEVMTDVSKTMAPVDTGNLRSGIDFEELPGPIPAGRVFTQCGYGAYQELGTSRMPAQPYLAPAFQVARRQVLNGR